MVSLDNDFHERTMLYGMHVDVLLYEPGHRFLNFSWVKWDTESVLAEKFGAKRKTPLKKDA